MRQTLSNLAVFFVASLTVIFSSGAWATMDSLAAKPFDFKAANPAQVMQATANNLKDIFLRYKPEFDSSTKIITPYAVSGTETNPVISVTVQKCVLFMCPTITLDGTTEIKPISGGSCDAQYLLSADLTRSSSLLANSYNELLVNICYHTTPTGGHIDIKASAQRGPSYSGNPLDKEVFQMLLLQIAPMSAALQKSLAANTH